MLTLDKIYDASHKLKGSVRTTPLIYCPALSDVGEVYLKCENLQVTGSFKVRGATYKISQLTDEEKSHGVIACSAGNHSQGVARAATMSGISSKICLPAGAPISKIEATRRFGGEVVLVPGVYDDAYAKALEIRDQENRSFIPPFDDELVIAGQGTIGLELMNQLPELDAIVVPIGGGGLISGIAFAVKQINPACKIYGVQAAGAASMFTALHEDGPTTLEHVSTFADGIAVKRAGDLTYQLVEKYVDEILTVTEDEIAAAILALMERQKLVAEGAGAVPVAALMQGKIDVAGKKVACIVSGGNIDVTILSRVVSRGLLKSGRLIELNLETMDKPGQLERVSHIVAQNGANLLSIHHDRDRINMPINTCVVSMQLETKDTEQIASIRRDLTKAGFIIH